MPVARNGASLPFLNLLQWDVHCLSYGWNMLGRMLVMVKLMDKYSFWMQFLVGKEVDEVLSCGKDLTSSPFVVVEKWMEVIGCPSHLAE